MDKIWLDNCKKLKVPDSVADNWLKCLKNKQQPSGPNRIYHHWEQVVDGKKEFLSNASSAIILAVFFQYFEYDVKKNCVELNCLEFRKFVSEAKIEDEKLIKTTLKLLGDDSVENVDGAEEDMQLFRDIDLAVLGKSTENYDTYARQLRQEYSHMDDASYKQMRLKKKKRKQEKGNRFPSTPNQSLEVSSSTGQEASTSSSNQVSGKRIRSRLSSSKENDADAISAMLDKMLNSKETEPRCVRSARKSVQEEIIVLDDDEEDEVVEPEEEEEEPRCIFFEDRTPASKKYRKTALYSDSLCLLDESDCILLDNSVIVNPKEELIDDSIIFVSEDKPSDMSGRRLSEPSTALDYIGLPPLSQQELTNLIRPKRTTQKPQKPQKHTTEVKEMPKIDSKYNTNLYNPDKDSLLKPGKRIIIVDGNNVAFGHGLSNGFSSEGIKICVEYFQKMGHDIKVVVPQFRMQKASNNAIMEILRRTGVLVTTPCKSLLNQKTKTSYDDRFVLQLASELDGVVISNDNYRDLMNECPEFKFVIENRVIGYTWCSNMFILPKDPYGRFGPKLDDILVRK